MELGTLSPTMILALVVGLALAPYVAVMITAFTKLVIVFSLLRNALGLQQTPPNLVLNGLAIILSVYVMYPVGLEMAEAARPAIERPAANGNPVPVSDLLKVAEGAKEKGGEFVTSGAQTKVGEARLGGISAVVAAEIEKRTGKEARNCVLGHLQRGGSPTTFDRALCSMFGATAVELIAAGDFGRMVAYQGAQVGAISLSEAVGKLKTVKLDGNLIRTARALGISLGD